AVLARGQHRFFRDFRRRLAERAEDASGVEPAGTFLGEYLVPVDLAWFKLAHCRMAAIAASEGRAHTEAALGEVEAIAHRAADAVILCPFQVGEIDTALQHQILDQPPDGVVGQCRDDRSLKAETAAESARDVVLAAALPDLELARGGHTNVAGIESQHDLAEADEVPFALCFLPQHQTVLAGHRSCLEFCFRFDLYFKSLIATGSISA